MQGNSYSGSVSSELAPELLPASLGPRLFDKNCKTDELSGGEWIMHLEQVRRYHRCTCMRYNSHLPRCNFSIRIKTGTSRVQYHFCRGLVIWVIKRGHVAFLKSYFDVTLCGCDLLHNLSAKKTQLSATCHTNLWQPRNTGENDHCLKAQM